MAQPHSTAPGVAWPYVGSRISSQRGQCAGAGAGSHRLLLDALCDGLRSLLVRLEEADDAGSVGVQDVFILIPHHQVQREDPAEAGTG